jgi:hypothetical protein
MPILNYTTSVKASQSIAEICAKLAKAGAGKIMQEYRDGVVVRIAFTIHTPHGEHAFTLPANIEKVHAHIVGTQRVEARFRTYEHAGNVAWRILKDWVEAQLAIIETDMVTMPQIFLPYMQVGPDETIYERFEKQGFPRLAPPSSKPAA